MRTYRVYSLDAYGRISFAEDIRAATDQEALRLARDVKPNATKCELWEGRRLVATLNGAEWALDPV